MKNLRKKIIKLIVYCLFLFFVGSALTILIFRWVNPPITVFMVYKFVKGNHELIIKEWEPLEEISPLLPLAVIASEDQNFLYHHGFDYDAIKKALKHNEKGKKVRGGSTISQQLSKNLFLFPTKSYIRKGVESYFTFLIELFWSKRRIMEVYLNVIELGDGVYGASAAAKMYFGKDAVNLTQTEASLIVTALPNPLIYKLSQPSPYMYSRSEWVRRQMNNLGGKQLLKDWYQ